MTSVLVFGSFDPLHEGHRHFFTQARALGSRLIVVVARDSMIAATKGRHAYQPEADRLQAVARVAAVAAAVLGNTVPHHFELLRDLDFEVLALGFDQQPSNEEAQAALVRAGKRQVRVVRLPAYKPEQFSSSRLRLKQT